VKPLMRALAAALLLPLLASCAHQVDRSGTLATLHQARPDTQEVPVDQGLDRAVQSYGDFSSRLRTARWRRRPCGAWRT